MTIATPPAGPFTDEQYELLFETIPHLVWMADANGATTYVNRWGLDLIGAPRDGFERWNWLDLVHPDDRDSARRRWLTALDPPRPYTAEFRLRHADGAYRWYVVRGVPIVGGDGRAERWIGTGTDIHEQRAADDVARRDAMLLANVRDAVAVTDLNGIVTYWNDGATRLFGLSAEEMVGRSRIERLPPEARAEAQRAHEAAVNGASQTGEYLDYRRDGTRVWIESRLDLIRDRRGRSVGVMRISHDITERKEVELARDRLANRLRMHVERMPLACLTFDAAMRIVDWNPAAERIFGFSRDEMVGTAPPYAAIVPESEWSRAQARLERVQQGDMSAHGVDRNRTKDGRTVVCRWHNTPLLDEDGRFLGVVALGEDITEQQRAAEALQASEERFRQLADAIHEVFWMTSADKAEMLYVSPAYEEIWERSPQSLYESPLTWMDAIHPDDRARVRRAALSTQADGSYDEEYRIVRPDGTIRWIRDRAFPVTDASGQVVRIAGVAEDVTRRRVLEDELHQAQKMEAIGQLAGGVAHDFNNHLVVINGYSELLLETLPAGDPARDLAAEIKIAGDRCASLTAQLLAFSRKQVLSPALVNVDDVVRDTEKMLRRLIGDDVELCTSLESSTAQVRVDPGQLVQVLMNLAVNARDAMPHGGTLRLATRCEERRAPSLAATPRCHVVLTVADSGVGMSEETCRRIFDPFFTTKPAGVGTGLGLSVVHGIVAQSDGEISVHSAPGEGTTFEVWLPCATPGAGSRAGDDAGGVRQLQGSETILVVDDDDSVRTLYRRVLRRYGYTVLEARHGDAALELMASANQRIDLLLTDVVMPRMSGRVLAERLCAAFPGLRVLYVSGYTDDAVVRHGVTGRQMNFLQKPFLPAVLAARIRDVLSRAA